jgi:hypothetical protein
MVLMGVHREDGLFIREISNLGLHRFTRNLWEIHDIVQEQLFKSDVFWHICHASGNMDQFSSSRAIFSSAQTKQTSSQIAACPTSLLHPRLLPIFKLLRKSLRTLRPLRPTRPPPRPHIKIHRPNKLKLWIIRNRVLALLRKLIPIHQFR